MSIPKLAGIETEFAIVCEGPPRAEHEVVRAYRHVSLDPSPDAPAAAGQNPCAASYSDSDLMLQNGARFYVDHTHPEFSTAESADPRAVVALERAGAEIVRRCAEYVNRASPERPPVRIYKNNSDHRGNSYGCHENYLLDAGTYSALFGNKAHWIFAYLVPFLVSRVVYTGAGKVGAENGTEEVAYQLSQRADFFERVVGLQTTHHRPIVNTRDEPHADAERFRRLHVIAGDANMCPFAGWLKVGTAQIILRMLEDGALGGNLYLADPVSAVRQISRDPTCRARVRLEDGRELTAVEIQTSFLEYAQRYFASADASEAEAQVMSAWEAVLLDLSEEPMRLAGKLDWVTKRQIVDELAAQDGWDCDGPQAHLADIKYHALDPEEGIFLMLEAAGLIEELPGGREAAGRHLREPPDDSRAYFRGGCIAKFARHLSEVDWEAVSFGKHRVYLPDPLAMNRDDARDLLEQARKPSDLIKALKDLAPAVDGEPDGGHETPTGEQPAEEAATTTGEPALLERASKEAEAVLPENVQKGCDG